MQRPDAPAAWPAAFVLLNPLAAGGHAAQLAPTIQRLLDLHPAQPQLHRVASVDHARDLLMRWPRGSRVVLAGGDGTVHHMLPALLERDHQLGLLPCGAGNDTARAFGVHGLPLPEALNFALQGQPLATDLGELRAGTNRTLFISSLAAGFDAAVAQRALRVPGWLQGMPRYLWAMLAELASLRRYPVKATLDGSSANEGDTLFASTLNTPTYGAGMPAVPRARLDDGRLDLLVAGHFGVIGALAMMPRLLRGTHLGHARVHTTRYARLRIQSRSPMPLAADGEMLPDATDFEVRCRAGVLAAVRKPS